MLTQDAERDFVMREIQKNLDAESNGSVASVKLKPKIIKIKKLCRQLTEGFKHSNPGIKHLILSQHMNNFNST